MEGITPWTGILDCTKKMRAREHQHVLLSAFSFGHNVTYVLQGSAKTNPAVNALVNYFVTETRKATTVIYHVALKGM